MPFELNCMGAELARAVSLADQVGGHGTKVPILKAIMISVSKGSAVFAATNTDHAVRVTIAAEGDGEIYVETALMLQKAMALRPNQPVTIKGDEKLLSIVQGKTRYRVPLLDGKGFPLEFTKPIEGDPIDIPQPDLFAAMNAVAATIVPDMSHTIGSGVLLDMVDGFRVVGAQKKGLAVVQIAAPQLPHDIIVPLDTIRALSSIFKESGFLSVVVTPDGICVSDDGVMYRSKLIEAKYPDWRRARDSQIGGGKLDQEITVMSADFLECMARATAISIDRQKDAAVTAVRVEFSEGECLMTAKNRISEEGADACEIEGDGRGTIGLGIANINNALSTLRTPRLSIKFAGNGAEVPILVSPEPPSELDDYRLVMPMLVGAV